MYLVVDEKAMKVYILHFGLISKSAENTATDDRLAVLRLLSS